MEIIEGRDRDAEFHRSLYTYIYIGKISNLTFFSHHMFVDTVGHGSVITSHVYSFRVLYSSAFVYCTLFILDFFF
jgi:hypothetical protein